MSNDLTGDHGMKTPFYFILVASFVLSLPVLAADDDSGLDIYEPPTQATPDPNKENQAPASGAIQVDEGGSAPTQVIESIPSNDDNDPILEPPSHAKKTKAARKAAPKSGGKFMITRSECPMYKQSNPGAAIVNTLTPGKKIWTEPANNSWVQVYRANGEAAFIKKSCLK
jgi:hypothetical protein